ncbi:hypothetical protein [Shewanella sp. MM_2022_3]|uniref:hypothetical protein n=1 Tax=Shewanella sp. MM_2022_3 TaxID=2923280 RepID=UPI001F4BFF00|nr:hypothetical protein [Shewanella sp. MM_2022_3]MCH7421269.1 hypothetical protein [Shewanella sp. MM_2022_3]
MAAKSPKNVQATAPEQTANLPVPFEEITEAKAVELGPLLYTEPGALKPYLDHIKASVNEVPDLTTTKGRDRIASLAASVSRSKGVVEKPCRAYLKHLKAVVKPIEQNIKEFVDECDALRDKTREPLTKWEEEQKAILERLKAKVDYFGEEYQSMLENMPSNVHERADFIKAVLEDIKAEPVGDDFESMKEAGEAAKAQTVEKMTLAYQAALIESDNQRKVDAQAEQDRLAREKQIAEEAATKAKADAQAELQAQIKQAEIDKQAAIQRANQAAIHKHAADQIIQLLNGWLVKVGDVLNSVEAKQCLDQISRIEFSEATIGTETERVWVIYNSVYETAKNKFNSLAKSEADKAAKDEAERKAKEEADRKAANVEHRRKINQTVMQQLIAIGATEELSKAIITAAAKGELGAMTIRY